jgi:hypothetical protein
MQKISEGPVDPPPCHALRVWNHTSDSEVFPDRSTVDATINAREAVKVLDVFGDRLASLLLEADHFRQQGADIARIRESLFAELQQVSKDAISLATTIGSAKGQPRGQAIDPTIEAVEVNAAVGRVVAACNRADHKA